MLVTRGPLTDTQDADCGCGGECGPCAANFGLGVVEPLDGPVLPLWAGPSPPTEAVWLQDAEELPDLDLVISAGPGEVVDGRTLSCDPGNAQTCSLYHLMVRSGVVRVQVVRARNPRERRGYVQPSIAPDGESVAYIVKGDKPDGTQRNIRLAVTELPGGVGAHHSVWEPGEDSHYAGPQWPDWWAGNTLLFDTFSNNAVVVDDQNHQVFGVAASGGTPANFLPSADSLADVGHVTPHPLPYFGPWWSDVEVLRIDTATSTSLVAQRNSRTGEPAYPAVVRFDSTGAAIGVPETVEHPTVPDPAAALLTACHHPSWMPAGTAFTCFGQSPQMELTDRAKVRPLYRFRQDGSAWVADGPLLFTPLTPLEVSAVFDQPGANAIFPSPLVDGGCRRYSYKYPAWVHRDWVVCTLFCEDEDGAVLSSRTVAVRLSDRTVVDLVRFVEVKAGVPTNSWFGHTGTGLKRRLSSEPTVGVGSYDFR